MTRSPLKLLAKFLGASPESLTPEMARERLKHWPGEALRLLSFRLSRWAPHARQAEFLALDCEEALYGGAAGGGKTEALLAWLSEGINNPRYAAVIFRRTYPQLSKADGLIAKCRLMYGPLGGEFK